MKKQKVKPVKSVKPRRKVRIVKQEPVQKPSPGYEPEFP